MANEPFGFLTNVGQSRVASAIANGTVLEIAEIAIGDGERAITGGETALENELARFAIQADFIDPENPNVAVFRRELAADDGPFVIAEAGLFSPNGDLIAIVKYPIPLSKPQGFVLGMDVAIAFSDLDALSIRVTTSVFVPGERRVNTGGLATGGGDLSQDRTIVVPIATPAEAQAGVRTDVAVTPAGLKSALALVPLYFYS